MIKDPKSLTIDRHTFSIARDRLIMKLYHSIELANGYNSSYEDALEDIDLIKTFFRSFGDTTNYKRIQKVYKLVILLMGTNDQQPLKNKANQILNKMTNNKIIAIL